MPHVYCLSSLPSDPPLFPPKSCWWCFLLLAKFSITLTAGCYWRVPPIRDDPLARNRRFYFFGDFSFLLVGMFHMAGYCGIGLRVCHIFLKFFVKTGKIGQKSYRLIKKLCFTRGMMVKIRGENCVSYKWVYPLVRNRRCQLTWPPKHVSYWWNPPVLFF